jgi:hypothetical protein
MAGSLRAALVLAALALTVSGTWQFNEDFSDSACTTSTGTDYNKLLNCVEYQPGMFITQTCEGGKIKNSVYSDTACTSLTAAGEPEDVTCQDDGEENGKKKYKKTSCVASLPSGYIEMALTYYTASADCTGASMAMSSAVKTADIGPCKDGEITTMTPTAMTRKKYTAADCSGTPNTTVTQCGSCSPQGSASMMIPCSTMAALTGVASDATALKVSKVAAGAFAFMVAYLA